MKRKLLPRCRVADSQSPLSRVVVAVQIPQVPNGRNSRMGGIFFRGKDTEFQFCLKQSFFTVRTEKGPPSAGCTEKSGMFWLPPHHNQHRDRHERSDSCSLVPHLTFEQKTSPLDTPFSRKASSKLLTFQWIFKKRNDWRLASIQPEIKLPLKYSLFGSDTEKTLFEAEPPGRFLKEKNIPPIREFRPFGTCEVPEL